MLISILVSQILYAKRRFLSAPLVFLLQNLRHFLRLFPAAACQPHFDDGIEPVAEKLNVLPLLPLGIGFCLCLAGILMLLMQIPITMGLK